VVHGGAPVGATRPYDGPAVARRPATVFGPDHRYARPVVWSVRRSPHAAFGPPGRWWYRPYYGRWWVHPYYRYQFATVAVVSFAFVVSPWTVAWAPPPRAGFVWLPGYWMGAVWVPGHWRPLRSAPLGYVWVPGWWEGDVYVEGYYRLNTRDDGSWTWVEGGYLPDGTYTRGYWAPGTPAPEGYVWEPGLWDGETLVDGFWRPEHRPGFVWMSSYYDASGVFHAGTWVPQEDRPGQVWVPGWFDGNTWIDGYWVDEATYRGADVDGWVPDEGWNDGWNDAGPPQDQPRPTPLALPVDATW
jgi:hypothetical protein